MLERDENMQADDAPNAVTFGSETPIGNRPASNARQVESAVPHSRDWRGGENAADFLGLDQDSQGAGAAPLDLSAITTEVHGAPGGASPSSASSSWLLGLDESEAAGLEPIADGARASEGYDGELQTPAPFEASYTESTPQRRLQGLLMPSIAALTLVGLAVALYKIYTVPAPRPAPETAALSPDARPKSTPRPLPPTNGARPAKDALAANGAEAPAERAVDFGREANATSAGPIDRTRDFDEDAVRLDGESENSLTTSTSSQAESGGHDLDAGDEMLADTARPAAERFEAWMRVNGPRSAHAQDVIGDFNALERGQGADNFSGHLPHAAGSPFLRTSGGSAADEASGSDDVGGSVTARGREGLARRNPGDSLGNDAAPAMRNGMRRASKAELAGLWEGSAVPIEAIGSTSRLLTPAVGRVRAILKGGEIFEGRLYAVGDQKIWLDTDLGRMALLGDQVRKIDQISSPSGTAILGAPGSQELAGLPRVRVRTPGGMFYGKVIARDERTVTLITEEGAKVTLESDDVEDAPLGKTYIVRPEKP